MRQRNNGHEDADVLHNQFTAYLLTAIKRYKFAYIKKQNRLRAMISLEEYDLEGVYQADQDFNSVLPLLEQIDNPMLYQALLDATERERYLLLSRVLDERSFNALAADLGISYKAATNSYYRLLTRLRRMMGGDEDV